MQVRIERRFHGPQASGNGGYTCGVAATAIDGPAQVRLLRPPPLDRTLRLVATDEGAELLDGDTVIAQARPGEPAEDLPEPVTYEEAEQAAAEFDVKAYQDQHPFPSCFTCGPARAEDEGLRLFPGRTSRDLLVAWPWQPQESLAGPAGTLDPRYVWAALDCPSGLCWYHDPTYETAPHVLGQLTARIRRLPTAGQRLVAAGWLRSADGRKRHSGSAIWSDDGEVLAHAEATWVRLTEEQFEQFRVAR